MGRLDGKEKRATQARKYFFPVCKKKGNCEVSANSVIN